MTGKAISSPGLDEVAAAYEGIEEAIGFQTDAELRSYRARLRERTREQAKFIASRLPAPCKALEVGCGNGRLLIELALQGAIRGGLGLDLARSRIAFAREWAAEEQVASLEFEAADALVRPLPNATFGLAACITGALAYFDAAVPKSDASLLTRLHESLEPQGLLILELYPHVEALRLLNVTGGKLRTWKELPAEDPWRFYLSTLSFESGVLTHEKTFVHRQTGSIDEGRRERLRVYSAEELGRLLERSGFADVRRYDGWTELPYGGGEVMVVTALRGGGERPVLRPANARPR